MSFTTETRFSSPAGVVEIRNYHWPAPLDDVLGAEAAVFGLSLSRVPDGSIARFHGEGGGPDFRRDAGRPHHPPQICEAAQQCRPADRLIWRMAEANLRANSTR